MSNPPNNVPEEFDLFEGLFSEAEKSNGFWISKAKYKFTEEMLMQMEAIGLKKADLAVRLDVKPAQITRLCSGQNNFTIDTMVRVARALNCEFRCHLQPDGVTTHWIDVLPEEPAAALSWTNCDGNFQDVQTEQSIFNVSEQRFSHVSPYLSPAA